MIFHSFFNAEQIKEHVYKFFEDLEVIWVSIQCETCKLSLVNIFKLAFLAQHI